MPAHATVSAEEVVNAGQGIIGIGRKVTGWSLRRQIGRGQPDRLFALWEQSQQQAENLEPFPESVARVHLPPALNDQAGELRTRLTAELDTVSVALWITAERVASERLGAEVVAAEHARSAAEAELAEAAEALEAADAARDRLAAELAVALEATGEAKQQASVELQRYRGEAETILREAWERAARFEAVAEERARLLDRKQAAIDTLTAERAEAREATAEAERRVTAAEAKTRAVEEEIHRVKAEEMRRRDRVEADLRMFIDRAVRFEAFSEERARVIDLLTQAPSPEPAPIADAGALPVVSDRLALPRKARDAYDDGLASGRSELNVPSMRFQPGGRLAHLRV